MANKHTPGEWRTHFIPPDDNVRYLIRAPGRIVCLIPEVDRANAERTEADANLIAAAPDLLAALEPFASIKLDAATVTVLGTGFALLVRDARAAIRKARGEEV